MIGRLLAGEVDRVTALANGRLVTGRPVPALCYPGSFNPLHAGHIALARVAADLAGAPLSFELSVHNVDKPPLSTEEITARLAQFAGRADVELTAQPTFAGKAVLMPGTTFVVGVDTARRLLDPAYYGGSPSAMAATLEGMWTLGTRFLVAGRLDPSGRFTTLDDVVVPGAWRRHFQAIPEGRFRIDMSSSELRNSG